MLGATDRRVGAVAADITWNNLGRALFPNDIRNDSNGVGGGSGDTASGDGVFKKLWAGYLFSAGFPASGTRSGPRVGANTAADPAGCGRFAADLCRVYQRAATSGRLDQSAAALLNESSPASVLNTMKAPTLLTQGEQDSLFPLSEADANARQLSAAGVEVTVRWRSGGHDAPNSGDDVSGWQRSFFDHQLRGKGHLASAFLLDQRAAAISATNGRRVDTLLRADSGYPGTVRDLTVPRTDVPLTGPIQNIDAPAGGTPAAVSSIPALGDLLGAAADAGSPGTVGLSRLPGQTAVFTSPPRTRPLLVTGASTVSLTFGAGPPVTAFLALHDFGPDGSDVLPARLVAPIRLPGSQVRRVTSVQLPWVVAEIPTGHRLAVVVSTTDFAYALPVVPSSYSVGLSSVSPVVSVPSLPVSGVHNGGTRNWLVLAGAVVLGCLGYSGWRLRSRRPSAYDPSLAGVPIVVTDLIKEYQDGYRAVDGVSFRVERGQVLGLLGPNGAGKTTTLRVLMGLILPTAGSIRVFGHEVVPGDPALAALGAFVEGPGLLPHLSGRDNLMLYWAASGRPIELAQLDTVLEIAGLGGSLDRKVKAYSHGMQQRLAIAQAMLGLPEVLVLDEPTNGLDPPQIAEMREVLHRYAATGRTVIVSSHLLAEVEQTCSHVVVMHRGRLVAAGSVSEVAGDGAVQLVVEDAERARSVLLAAGIAARPVAARRALEDVFLDLVGERND